MDFFAVKLICDVEIIPGKRKVRAGETVHVVKQFDGATYEGKPVLLVMHDSVADLLEDGFFLYGWEYTPDLSADVSALQAERIENKIQAGLAEWLADPARQASVESDSGGWWSLHGDPRERLRWMVSWIENTGELYAWNKVHDQYIVLGKTEPGDEARAEFWLEGWADAESSIYNNLTALVKQIEERQDLPTPTKFKRELPSRSLAARAW